VKAARKFLEKLRRSEDGEGQMHWRFSLKGNRLDGGLEEIFQFEGKLYLTEK
jgi:hypothetical protein